MYMANARNLRHLTPEILLVFLLVFFALGYAKVLSFALADAKVPNAISFASQWNIGLKIMSYLGVVLTPPLQNCIVTS